MSYSQFTLETIESTFDITIVENVGTFAEISSIKYSDFLIGIF
jgi:hypothetical protein